MNRELIRRRDAAARRHDDALAGWPGREGAAFEEKMR
jgi:hypothetical protein